MSRHVNRLGISHPLSVIKLSFPFLSVLVSSFIHPLSLFSFPFIFSSPLTRPPFLFLKPPYPPTVSFSQGPPPSHSHPSWFGSVQMSWASGEPILRPLLYDLELFLVEILSSTFSLWLSHFYGNLWLQRAHSPPPRSFVKPWLGWREEVYFTSDPCFSC